MNIEIRCEPLYCIFCGREWGFGRCDCPHPSNTTRPPRYCHLCGAPSDQEVCNECLEALKSRRSKP